jgi:ADP-heptose:LPS heptosyltransferase
MLPLRAHPREIMRFDAITVILPKARGATLLSTVALRRLREKFPNRNIFAIAQFPELLQGLPYIDRIFSFTDSHLFDTAVKDNDVIDLTGTLDYQPNRRPVPIHLIDLLCKRAGVERMRLGPEFHLTSAEIRSGQQIVDEIPNPKRLPIVAIGTRTSTRNKEWPRERWCELVEATKSSVKWVHLGDIADKSEIPHVHYCKLSLREDIAVLRLVHGIVCLDTFLLHAVASQRAEDHRVIVLLGSTCPECVSYPAFCNIFRPVFDCQPCCRPYHALDRLFNEDGTQVVDLDGKVRKWECSHVSCMNVIEVAEVHAAIKARILQCPVNTQCCLSNQM